MPRIEGYEGNSLQRALWASDSGERGIYGKGKGASEGKGNGSGDCGAKKVAIYLVKRYSGLTNQEIGKLFGGVHYSAVSKSSASLEREIAEDSNLRNCLKDPVSKIKP